ncbi:MAG: class I SAM-dependent methyltransferase [Gammaproteobacteria bacterium]|nr:class I SAM-dependent methyltransferase [Gammaproteobacteria bacterium]MCP5409607.1 class I SAM-dependent methyltransferase [Chromatiaceae bacterium]MCP5441514.1 class I SAM-dependent methyltransferase [Chromatiaceae bacterium]
MNRPLVALAAGQPEVEQALDELNRQLHLPRVLPGGGDSELLLVLTSERLELRQNGVAGQGPVFVDFVSGRLAHRRLYGDGRAQPLARAIGLKKGRNPQVLDATAGLGRDAFVLATLGCELVMLERSPVIAALLRNGLERALADDQTAQVVRRMQLHCGDAIDYLNGLDHSQKPQVIYMDPMYPHRKKSALVKKEMRLFRRLVGEDADSAELLSAARRHARHRVVVKRPAGAAWVGDEKPAMEIKSPNTRYDVYVNSGLGS